MGFEVYDFWVLELYSLYFGIYDVSVVVFIINMLDFGSDSFIGDGW